MPRLRETPAIWLRRIAEAKEVADRWIMKSDPYVRAYNGIFPASITGLQTDSVDNNYVLAVTRSLTSTLFFRNPRIAIPPRTPEDQANVHLTEGVVNAVIRETKIEKAFTSAIRDAILRGGGWVKFGYHSESPPPADKEVVYNSEDADVHRENELLLTGQLVEAHIDEDHDKHIAAHQALFDDPQILINLIEQQGDVAAAQLVAHLEEHRKLKRQIQKEGRIDWAVAPNEVWAKYVDSRDVLIDSNATSLDDARWIAFRSVRPLGAVKRDPTFRYTRNLEGGTATPHREVNDNDKRVGTPPADLMWATYKTEDMGVTNLEDLDDPDTKLVELFEIWDRQSETIKVVCHQVDGHYLREEPSPFMGIPGFFPAVQIVLDEKPGHGGDMEAERPYGYSMIEPWWYEQLELNFMESLRLAIARHNIPKYEVPSSLSDDSLTALTDAVVGGVIRVDRGPEGQSNTPTVRPVQLLPASIDVHQTIVSLRDSISFKAGLSEIQLGQASTARTATATQVQVASSSARVDKMLDRIENAFQHAAKIILALVRQHYTTERMIALEGPDGFRWQRYRGADLYGAELVVENHTSHAQNAELEKYQALQIYNLLAQDPWVKRRELLTHVLRKHGVPSPSLFMKTDEEVQAEQQALQMMQAQQATGAMPGGAAGEPLDPQMAQQQRMGIDELSRRSTGDKFQSGLTF